MIIEYGNPTEVGLYVAYLHDPGWPKTQEELLFWDSGWYYRGDDQEVQAKVVGWVGPLDILFQ